MTRPDSFRSRDTLVGDLRRPGHTFVVQPDDPRFSQEIVVGNPATFFNTKTLEVIKTLPAPGADGYLGVLPGHTPLLTTLKVGELWYLVGTQKSYLAVAFGFAEVLPDRVTILAQIAADELDVIYERIEIISADTARTPNEGMTAGSLSIESSGTALRFACAEARGLLLAAAAKKLNIAAVGHKQVDHVIYSVLPICVRKNVGSEHDFIRGVLVEHGVVKAALS